MILKSATDDLQLVTSANGDIDVICEFADLAAAGTVTVDRDLTFAITTITTTEILPGIAANSRKVKHLMIRNVHATVANTITVQYNDNGTTGDEIKTTLLAQESLEYVDGEGWKYLDANGYLKVAASVPAASDTVAGISMVALQADMEAASSLVLQSPPGRQHFHPSAAKCWLKCGVAADVTASYNITSLTDTGTGIVTVTIATDFSSTAWSCVVSCEMSGTTYTVASVRKVHIASATQAAGSVAITCLDETATSNLVKDPVFYHMQGLGDHA